MTPERLASNRPDPGTPVFYGRRHGRRLRRQPAENLEWGLDHYGIDADTVECAAALPPQALFNDEPDREDRPVFLEIGFGGGEHLAARAEESPGACFIGAEPFMNGVAGLCGHIRQRGLTNIRIWPEDVRLFLPLLPDACLDGAFILFPDPWPKFRHRERRILQPVMIDQLARLIRPGGELLLASDDATAKTWLLQSMLGTDDFAWQARRPADWRQPPPGWPGTRYMAKAEKAGRRSAWFLYRRQDRQNP